MNCSGKPERNRGTKEYTVKDLMELRVGKPDEKMRRKVQGRWDLVAKPVDGMGRFEALTAQIGAICGTDEIDISRRAILIMCADNGIVEEGVSQSGQEVTLAVAKNMAGKKSSVGRMAEKIGADTIPVDIGINHEGEIPGVLNRKVRCGTGNFMREPAMTEGEALKAIFTGIELVAECREKGYKLLGVGEMGIGNTTTSSAVTAALLKCGAAEVTGRGSGLTDEKLEHKRLIVAQALEKYGREGRENGREYALRVLRTMGGLDIAGLAGVCMGGALFHVPIVLDGVISMAAALVAERLLPGTADYLLPSHRGKEPAVEKLMRELRLKPVIEGEMALGEGTGAVMMFALLDLALEVYKSSATFSDIRMEKYERYS